MYFTPDCHWTLTTRAGERERERGVMFDNSSLDMCAFYIAIGIRLSSGQSGML